MRKQKEIVYRKRKTSERLYCRRIYSKVVLKLDILKSFIEHPGNIVSRDRSFTGSDLATFEDKLKHKSKRMHRHDTLHRLPLVLLCRNYSRDRGWGG